MKELSLFTGAGGGVYGTKLLGWKTIGYVEFDDYCQQIIAARIKDGIFDYAPIFTDIRAFSVEYAAKYSGLVDVITAGFPCQPFSTAGKQKADADERNMWPFTLQVIKSVQPQWCLLENVPGLLGRHRYFETILKDLSEAGYDASWTCISAQGVGAPHKRNRLWIVAMANAASYGLEGSNGSICRKQGKAKRVFPESFRSSCRVGEWWEVEPSMGRVADGVANRSNRLKALGNGQVPGVVREAWHELLA
jgi:DNA (cytosine-5)-methyltransferase 1